MYDPYSTTERGTGYYLRHPIPPPPPSPEWSMKKQHSVPLSLFIALSIITGIFLLLFIGAGMLYWSAIPRTSLTPAEATPTLNAEQAMDSSDFSVFIRGFAQAMANKQYDIIKSHVDTNNFQSIVLYADGGYGTWQDAYDQLTTGNISFTVQYPIITAAQESYGCVGYSQQGIPGLMKIDAQSVQYVVGTASEPNSPDGQTLQTAPNATVFVFEQPNEPGGYWLWRGYILNNVANCKA